MNYPEVAIPSMIFSRLKETDWFINKDLLVYSYYDGTNHQEVCSFHSFHKTGQMEMITPRNGSIFVNRANICFEYIKEHYPEVTL